MALPERLERSVGIRRQRHEVRPPIDLFVQAALHGFGGDGQHAVVQVQPRPFHGADIAGALKQQGGQQQRGAGHGLAGVAVDGAQKFARLGGLQHGGHVLDHGGRQGATQVGDRVVGAAAGLHAVAKDLAGTLAQGVGHFQHAAPFRLAQRVQHHWRGDVGQRNGADVGEKVFAQQPQPAFGVRG